MAFFVWRISYKKRREEKHRQRERDLMFSSSIIVFLWIRERILGWGFLPFGCMCWRRWSRWWGRWWMMTMLFLMMFLCWTTITTGFLLFTLAGFWRFIRCFRNYIQWTRERESNRWSAWVDLPVLLGGGWIGDLVITVVLTIVWIFFSSSSSESLPEKPRAKMRSRRWRIDRIYFVSDWSDPMLFE